MDALAELANPVRRTVRAVVGDDVDLDPILRIAGSAQAADHVRDQELLVVRRDHHGETEVLGGIEGRPASCFREEGDGEGGAVEERREDPQREQPGDDHQQQHEMRLQPFPPRGEGPVDRAAAPRLTAPAACPRTDAASRQGAIRPHTLHRHGGRRHASRRGFTL